MTIRAKILLLAALALAGLAYILAAHVAKGLERYQAHREAHEQLLVAVALSDLLHELERERGVTMGYLTDAPAMAELLARQHADSGRALAALATVEPTSADLVRATVQTLRDQVVAGRALRREAEEVYTSIIVGFLDRVAHLATAMVEEDLRHQLFAYSQLLYAKEHLGLARSVLHDALLRGRIEVYEAVRLARHYGVHQQRLRVFLRNASRDMAERLQAVEAEGPYFNTARSIESVLLVHSWEGGGVPLDPEQWWTTATRAMDSLDGIGDVMMRRVLDRLIEREQAVARQLITNGGVTLFAGLLVLLVAVSTVRRMLTSLNRLLADVRKVTATKNFGNRISLEGKDEFGIISRGFNQLLNIADQLIAEKEALAATDHLTAVANRGRLSTVLEAELQRLRRYGGELALILFDLDHFKEINDTHGHHAGDRVLKAVAELTGRHIRSTDMLARWGGEEFAVLAPETGRDEALALADKLRQMVADQAFPGGLRLTASFGVAVWRDGDDADRLFRRADDALYAAKHAGRNRVVFETDDGARLSGGATDPAPSASRPA